MTLQEYSAIATIAASVATLVFIGASTVVAIFAYRWHVENAKIETTRKLAEDLRYYNDLVLSNEDLQQLVAASHRWGSLSKEEVLCTRQKL